MSWVSVIHFASCLYMTGVIWVIQLIHYPMFKVVNAHEFASFHAKHSSAMTLIVGPMMIVELVTAIFMARDLSGPAILNLASVVLLWCFTFFVSVPIHESLALNQDSEQIQRLVLTNWLRTVTWTLRALFLAYLVVVGRGGFLK